MMTNFLHQEEKTSQQWHPLGTQKQTIHKGITNPQSPTGLIYFTLKGTLSFTLNLKVYSVIFEHYFKHLLFPRPAVEQPIVYDDPGGGNQSHPTFATPLEGKMPYGDPRGVEQPKQQQGSSPTNNMRTLGKALVNTKLLAGRRLSIRQRRMRGKSTNYQVKDMQSMHCTVSSYAYRP